MKNISKGTVILYLLFITAGIFALQFPFSIVLGSSTKFTLYDFFAPTLGAFLGTAPGICSVLIMQIINMVIHGNIFPDAASVVRIFPTLFAVFYFSKKRTTNIIIPAVCMFIFNLHPTGKSAWQYSLFWLIPIAAHYFRKNLFVKSLGATFTAHAVGSVLWLWVFGLTSETWLALIPQVIMERTLFAGGISIFYLLVSKSISSLQSFTKSSHLKKHLELNSFRKFS